jgi:RES domain-containing protein
VRTDRILRAYRIGDPDGKYPIYDATGSRISPGRWNTTATPVIYSSEHYSTAMLEKLVHASSVLPPNQHYVRITIPTGTSYEKFQPENYPGWDGRKRSICEAFGSTWRRSGRSAILIVPSIPARIEQNIIINPEHPEAAAIEHDLPEPVWWDKRIYA